MSVRSGAPLRSMLLLLFCWTAGRVAAAAPWQNATMAWAADDHVRSRASFSIAPAVTQMADEVRHYARSPDPFGFHTPGFGAPHISTRLDVVPKSEGFSAVAQGAPASIMNQPFAGESDARPFLHHEGEQPYVASRWSMDAWLFWRDRGGPIGLSDSGQLGGSQAGGRLQYDLTPHSMARLAAYARLTSALETPAALEAAAGFAYQPSRSIPLSIAVERRVALGEGGRNAFAVLAVTGFGPVDVPFGLRSEGYAQAGMVGFRHRDAFVDGKVSVLRPLAGDKFSLGFSVSGGAQPKLGRLDIGPQIQARIGMGRKQSRLAAEWRQRIIGRARPGSGPAVTIAAGF